MIHDIYQALKHQVEQLIPLNNDTIHIYLGFGCYILTVGLFRLKPSSLWGLIPGLILSVLMEISDVHADMMADHVPRWLNSIKDIINTNLIPAALVIAASIRERRTGSR